MSLGVAGVGAICGDALGLAVARASTLVGLEAHLIRVEVCCTRGPSFFQLVGLAEAAVREARVRVASALARMGILIDEYAITVNLAPADLRKGVAALDVAIAAGLLGAVGALPVAALEGKLLLGELSLDGSLRPVRGVLPMLEGARRQGLRQVVVPSDNAREAGLVQQLDVRVARDLGEVVAHLRGQRQLPEPGRTPFSPSHARAAVDLSEIRGQHAARRALEIAAAGGHNLLFVGAPGSGKTLLARALPSILPPLDYEEALAVTAIHSVAGLIDPARGIVTTRPFRAPHHTVSEAGLVGGGDIPRPGEVSLAHHGVLFLDELAEFRRPTLESLRQPLQDGVVCIARARARAWFPARPLVVGATNPCACGMAGHPRLPCRCSKLRLEAYQARLSGPLLDRLDVHVLVPPVEVAALSAGKPGEDSASVAARVSEARGAQRERRLQGQVSVGCNAELSGSELDRVAPLDAEGQRLLERAVEQLGLSARAWVKARRLARTIADLARERQVRRAHVAEAIQLRLLDRPPAP